LDCRLLADNVQLSTNAQLSTNVIQIYSDATPRSSRSLFDRVIQTYGDAACGHHALCLIA